MRASRGRLVDVMQTSGKAIQQGRPENIETVESRIEKALSCPCVADIRASSCGKQFDAALSCFIRHEDDEDLAGTEPQVRVIAGASLRGLSSRELQSRTIWSAQPSVYYAQMRI